MAADYGHYRRPSRGNKAAAGWCAGALVWLIACGASAGGGPENVLLLVNANSESSRTIANHYIRWRRIPSSNVVYIDWQGSVEFCRSDKFRSMLLKPALDAIRDRRLALQIDYIIYSSDFPWRIDLRHELKDELEQAEIPKNFRPLASLTGATYLWQFVETKNVGLVAPDVNWYRPSNQNNNLAKCEELGRLPSRGFRYHYLWTRTGSKTTDASRGQRYMLSTMLGVTSGRGNTVDEVLSYLRRAVWADASHPDGTFYFVKNSDVRSSTRHNCFSEAAAQLRLLGQPAQVLEGEIPENKHDILGIMAGTAKFDLDSANDTILPGAVCEHLTSMGGVLNQGAGQTPLTDFLRHGAAGASGTVIEPYAIQAKFPLPSLPLHYVRGCSLAEAFYQSVSGPYQLLIVGDPLCQPWATPPLVELEGIGPGDEVGGTIVLKPSARPAPNHKIGFYEFYVDGALRSRFRPGPEPSLDTTKLADGYHELRIVAADANSIECQGRMIVPFRVNNHDVALDFTVTPQRDITAQATLHLSAHQPGAEEIVFLHHRRELGRTSGENGQIAVAANQFGIGPVPLHARSEGEHPAVSETVWIQIE